MAYNFPGDFEWDAQKSEVCFQQRGFDFAYVLRAFLDPLKIVEEDRRRDYGETRFQLLGKIEHRLFAVVYTNRQDALRLISARKANQREVQRYEYRARQIGFQ